MIRAETIQADVEMTLRHPAEAAIVCDMLDTSVTPPYFTLSITSPLTHFRLDLAACDFRYVPKHGQPLSSPLAWIPDTGTPPRGCFCSVSVRDLHAAALGLSIRKEYLYL